LLENLRAALKPGGVVGIIDNVAETDTDPKVAAMALHRIDPETVRRDFQQAGFVLEAESSLLRNTTDDHRLSVFDPMVHGHTDRFVMRFRRP
jgi:predicted methyltransferase